jgi:hypothetical protein
MDAHNATHAATNEPKKRLVMKKPPKKREQRYNETVLQTLEYSFKNSQITVP